VSDEAFEFRYDGRPYGPIPPFGIAAFELHIAHHGIKHSEILKGGDTVGYRLRLVEDLERESPRFFSEYQRHCSQLADHRSYIKLVYFESDPVVDLLLKCHEKMLDPEMRVLKRALGRLINNTRPFPLLSNAAETLRSAFVDRLFESLIETLNWMQLNDESKGQSKGDEIPPPEGFEGLGRKKKDFSSYFDQAGLTDRQRDCVSLRLEYKLNNTEIGSRLGIHRETVREHIAAATKRIDTARQAPPEQGRRKRRTRETE